MLSQLFVTLLLSLVSVVAAEDKGVGACEVIEVDGKVYDLGGLTRGNDYTLDDGSGGKVYIKSFNTTPTLLSPLLSNTNDVLRPPHSSISLLYSSGSSCPSSSSQSTYSTIFTFTCDYHAMSYLDLASEDRNEEIYLVSSADGCTKFVSWKTPWACPREGELMSWWRWTRHVFRFIFGGVFLALIVFAVYNIYSRIRSYTSSGGARYTSLPTGPTPSSGSRGGISGTFEWTKDMIVISGIFVLDKLESAKDVVFGAGTWGEDREQRWKFWRRTGGRGTEGAIGIGRGGEYWRDRERLLDDDEDGEGEGDARERFRDDI
ncbi:hypothetical protein BT69DRAFT_1333837 [Atractiella rhizophila]|nr:hypothetical protein BT69DRAFT_1333837 [Atractiella rhizophila]